MPRERELTSKQLKFVQLYLQTGRAVDAYKGAGYKIREAQWWRTDALNLLNNGTIQMALEGIAEERKQEIGITVQMVIDRFIAVYEDSVKLKDFTNANRALENLGKYLSMFTGKGDNVVAIHDSEELKKDIIRLAKVAGANVEFKQAA